MVLNNDRTASYTNVPYDESLCKCLQEDAYLGERVCSGLPDDLVRAGSICEYLVTYNQQDSRVGYDDIGLGIELDFNTL